MSDETLDEQVLDFLAGGIKARAPRGDLRSALLGRAGGSNRLLPFLDRMMTLFDLPEEQSRKHMADVDDPKAWGDAFPGIRYQDFKGGAALGEGAHAGFVCMQPGGVFPHHTHVGEESVLILQGELVDDKGNPLRAGDLVVSADGSSHELRVVGDREAIFASVVRSLTFRDLPWLKI